jgi:1,2-diacylglycerol 3-beta-galactosyltransferase
MRRILILTADFGYGHRSAADAIRTSLNEMHGGDCSVEIVNPLDDTRAPAFLRKDQKNYDRVVREMPELYKLGYQVSDTWVAGHIVKTTWTIALYRVLQDIIRKKQPDAIVCTYPNYQGILSAIFVLEAQRIPLLTVVTDFETVKWTWFHQAADLCLVPTRAIYDLAMKAGLSPEKVKITGIPVNPRLVNGNYNRDSLRRELGWHQELFTVLAMGSKRVIHLYDALQVLNHSGFPLQLVISAGGDEDLFQHLRKTKWHVKTHCYKFIPDLYTFMRGADCIMSKAGGLTVSEALACGLPLILVDVIPGQETGNAHYVVSNDAGVLVEEPMEILETLCHWLEKNRHRFHEQAKNALQLGRPNAAFDVAGLIWEAASSRGEGN